MVVGGPSKGALVVAGQFYDTVTRDAVERRTAMLPWLERNHIAAAR